MPSTEGPPSKMNWRGSACKNLQEAVVQLLEEAAQGRGIQGVVGAGAPLGGGDEALVGQEIHVVGNGGGGQAQLFGDVLAVALPGLQGPENFQPAFVTDGFQPAHQAGGLIGVLLNEIGEGLIIHSKINSGVCKVPAEAVEAHEAGIDGDGAGLSGDVQVEEHATGIVPDLLLGIGGGLAAQVGDVRQMLQEQAGGLA